MGLHGAYPWALRKIGGIVGDCDAAPVKANECGIGFVVQTYALFIASVCETVAYGPLG
jgi:ABC-type sulfate/molybdate transport systems ATPase subunit